MRKFATATAMALATCVMAAPASAATVIELDAGEDGALSGEFGMTINMMGEFTELFTFELPEMGTTGATISTVGSGVNNLDFIEVLLNGVAFDLTPNGRVQFGSLEGISTQAGTQNLSVRGFSAGNGSFAGTIAFDPEVAAAVPEPSTWALLLLGFAGVGFSMRRRKQAPRVRYDFA
ncbi:MAG: FxDxF family PEP-CTERM protein [Pontixanthobacter sp.]